MKKFNAKDASNILSIPLYKDDQEDILSSKSSPTGIYCEKLGYYCTMEHLIDNRIPNVTELEKIWGLKIMQRMKAFLLRALIGVLPTRQQRLQHQGVKCTGKCVFCEHDYANNWHVFFG